MTSPKRGKPSSKSTKLEKPREASRSSMSATDVSSSSLGVNGLPKHQRVSAKGERSEPEQRKSRSEPAESARKSEPVQGKSRSEPTESARKSEPVATRGHAARNERKGESTRGERKSEAAHKGGHANSERKLQSSEGMTVKPPRARPAPNHERPAATKSSAPTEAKQAVPSAFDKSTPTGKISIPHSPIVANGVGHAGDGGPTLVPPARRTRDLRKAAAAQSDALEVRDEPIWSDDAQGAAPVLGSQAPSHRDLAADSPDDAAAAFRLTRGSGGDRLREAAAFGSAQSLLSTDYYFRQYGAHGMRSLAAEVDDFGFDPHVDAKARPVLEGLCKRYFRVDVVGAEHIPQHGRALLVANRSGALPWDGLVLRTALRANRPELPSVRWLSEDSVIHYPFMGIFMNRLGAVRACPENAERLLVQNPLVAVFPEGAQGSRKLFRDRYRLQRFGRGGYVKLALKFGVPILPTAIIGGEETNPVLGRSRFLGRFFGSESVPLTPTFPWLGPAGLLPAPVKWRIVIGEPIDLSAHGVASADDALVVHRLNEQVRASLQALVDHGKRTRGGAFFG